MDSYQDTCNSDKIIQWHKIMPCSLKIQWTLLQLKSSHANRWISQKWWQQHCSPCHVPCPVFFLHSHSPIPQLTGECTIQCLQYLQLFQSVFPYRIIGSKTSSPACLVCSLALRLTSSILPWLSHVCRMIEHLVKHSRNLNPKFTESWVCLYKAM